MGKFDSIFERHKGPYTLIAYYPTRKLRTGYLAAVQPKKLIPNIEGSEVEEMACMLLTDPRDSVESVYVYSEREEQFVMGGIFRRHCESEGQRESGDYDASIGGEVAGVEGERCGRDIDNCDWQGVERTSE